MTLSRLILAAILAGCAVSAASAAEPLVLARDGATDYVIVTAADATPVDRYAAGELALYLKQCSGAEFPVVEASDLAAEAPALFVGLSVPALARLRGTDPLDGFANQEHGARSHGKNVYLYGRGIHGALHAVMLFLEDQIGWRWYSVFELPVIPSRPTLMLEPFRLRRGFSFAYRKVDLQRSLDYFYQQGMNMGFTARVRSLARRYGASSRLESFISAIPELEWGTHTLFRFIPPNAPSAEERGGSMTVGYFETHPEYFSLWEQGERVKNRQLCFSNPELRAELTRNILRVIEAEGEPLLLDVGAQDNPGLFCYCPGCKALAEQYSSVGGPLYDYLFELCALLAERHPGARIRTLAYRRAQTQKPPVLAAGQQLPGNLIVDFAPIEDNYFADWSHPDPQIQETYADLQAWNQITPEGNLWAWLYPNPYGSGFAMPVGNVKRLVTNMRKMHAAGVRGVNTDQSGYHQRGGWSELQAYLLYKLCQDIHCDTDALTVEFTDALYGAAAVLIRTYLSELEDAREALSELPPGVTYRSPLTDERTFPYLTPENLHRWQGYFDRMEALLRDGAARERNNVRFVRRELDLATLWRWFDLKKTWPEAYSDHQEIVDRIDAVNAIGALAAPDWEGKSQNRRPNRGPGPGDFATLIEAGGTALPLPSEFDGIDPDRIRQFVPRYPNNRGGRAVILDPEAAFGYGAPVAMPDLPFVFGYYRGASATRDPSALPVLPSDSKAQWARALNGTYTLQRALAPEEIVPGAYRVHHLGQIEIVPDGSLWFSNRSWGTRVDLGERLYEPGGDNRWEAHVSLKFLGPSYGDIPGEALLPLASRHPYQGMQPEDLVLVDRVILVNVSKDQFAEP